MKRTVAALGIVTLLAICVTTPVGAQELERGTWTGTMVPPRGDSGVAVMFEVGETDGALSIVVTMGRGGRSLAASEVKLNGDELTFRLEPSFRADCTLLRKEDGSFEGVCAGPDGEGTVTMLPPSEDGSLATSQSRANAQGSGPQRVVLVDQIAWVDPPDPLPANVTHGTFRSTSMDVEVGYSIYLPPGYEESVRRYPVVYWLHGAGGSERDMRLVAALHSLIEDRRVEPLVLVIANGGVRSGFIDKPSTGVMGESVIIRELMPHIEATYRVGSNAASRGIGGFSMGGGGAVRMALRYPEVFGAVVSVAGGLYGYAQIMEVQGVTYVALARTYDPLIQARTHAERLRETLRLQMFVGTSDRLLGGNREFRSYLEDLGVPHEYVEVEGVGHNLARYLEAVGPGLFEFFSTHLSSSGLSN